MGQNVPSAVEEDRMSPSPSGTLIKLNVLWNGTRPAIVGMCKYD